MKRIEPSTQPRGALDARTLTTVDGGAPPGSWSLHSRDSSNVYVNRAEADPRRYAAERSTVLRHYDATGPRYESTTAREDYHRATGGRRPEDYAGPKYHRDR